MARKSKAFGEILKQQRAEKTHRKRTGEVAAETQERTIG